MLRAGARVLEIGAGSGQATGAFVAAGARVLAVEPGVALAARLHQRFPEVEIRVGTAEEALLERGRFDSAVSATALHWVDLDVALPRIHEALAPGGLLAVWRTVFGNPAVATPFRRRVRDITARRGAPGERGTDPLDVEQWMAELTRSGHFTPLETLRLEWDIDLSTRQVRALFGTFSDWSVQEVAEAAAAADDLGGTVTEHYVTVLCVCRAASRV